MTQEEIRTKVKEIAVKHSRVWNDQEYGHISTEGDCYDSAMEIANWIVERMTIQEKPVNVPSSACITDDNQLIITTDLNALKRYETIKNGFKNSSDKALVQQALDRTRNLVDAIEGAMTGVEVYPETYYRMCQDIIEYLTKIAI